MSRTLIRASIYLIYLPGKGNKRKNNQWDCINLKSFCTAKKNINKIQTTHRMGEHIHQHEFTKHNTKKPNIPIKKWVKDLNRHFSKDIEIANRHLKRYSMSLIFREIQIRTTMRYQLTPIRITIINKSRNKCCPGCGEKGTLVHCWWECRLVQPLWKAVWRFLKKLKMYLPFDPVFPLLGLYPKRPKTLI